MTASHEGVAMSAGAWPSIDRARRHDAAARLPFELAGAQGPVVVGSVARSAAPALARWPQHLTVRDGIVALVCPPTERDAVLQEINSQLRAQGLVTGWRDEIFPVVTALGEPPLARIERAAARFWGTLTFGAHCNGYVAGAEGRAQQVWIARRALTKPTDPGMLDNLVGGGVPLGQTPEQTLVREGWEEAGLEPAEMAAATPGRVISLYRDIPEGLQNEQLHVFDLALPPQRQPSNQDGEVAQLQRLPVDEALSLAAGDAMTVDASLVMLDFALRRGLLSDAALIRRAAPLWWAKS